MNNSLGTDSHDIVVLKPGKPEAPSHIDLVATTDHSVTLSWRPGFDGGYNQSFVVSAPNIDELPDPVDLVSLSI